MVLLQAGADCLDLDCGIALSRIASWLEDELELKRLGSGWVFDVDGKTCTVVINSLEARRLGKLMLERTHLHTSGHPKALAEFEKLFTLRFISAGG